MEIPTSDEINPPSLPALLEIVKVLYTACLGIQQDGSVPKQRGTSRVSKQIFILIMTFVMSLLELIYIIYHMLITWKSTLSKFHIWLSFRCGKNTRLDMKHSQAKDNDLVCVFKTKKITFYFQYHEIRLL